MSGDLNDDTSVSLSVIPNKFFLVHSPELNPGLNSPYASHTDAKYSRTCARCFDAKRAEIMNKEELGLLYFLLSFVLMLASLGLCAIFESILPYLMASVVAFGWYYLKFKGKI